MNNIDNNQQIKTNNEDVDGKYQNFLNSLTDEQKKKHQLERRNIEYKVGENFGFNQGQFEADKSAFENEINILKNEIDEIGKYITEGEDDYGDALSQRQINKMYKKIKQKNKEIDDYNDKINKLEKGDLNIAGIIKASHNLHSNLKEKIELAENEIQSFKNRYTEDMDAIREDYTNLIKKYDLEKTKSETNDKNLKKIIENLEYERDELKKYYDKVDFKSIKSNDDFKEYDNKINDYKYLMEEYKKKFIIYKVYSKLLKLVNNKKIDDGNKFQKEVENKNTEIQNINKRINIYDGILKENEQKMEKLKLLHESDIKIDDEEYQNKEKRYQDKILNCQKNIEKLKNETKYISEANERLQNEIKNRDIAVSEFKNKYNELNQEINRLLVEKEGQIQTIQTLYSEIDSLKTYINNIGIESSQILKQYQNYISELEIKLKEYENYYNQQQQQQQQYQQPQQQQQHNNYPSFDQPQQQHFTDTVMRDPNIQNQQIQQVDNKKDKNKRLIHVPEQRIFGQNTNINQFQQAIDRNQQNQNLNEQNQQNQNLNQMFSTLNFKDEKEENKINDVIQGNQQNKQQLLNYNFNENNIDIGDVNNIKNKIKKLDEYIKHYKSSEIYDEELTNLYYKTHMTNKYKMLQNYFDFSKGDFTRTKVKDFSLNLTKNDNPLKIGLLIYDRYLMKNEEKDKKLSMDILNEYINNDHKKGKDVFDILYQMDIINYIIKNN